MKRVALYIRVSTAEQVEEGYSIGAQTDRLSAYCTARDWLIYEKYIDPGYSGANTDRPALKKMIHDIKHNKIDLVLVYKLDRLSRSQKDTLLLIEDVFNTNDVSFVSINENFDTSTPFGRAMVGMLSVFAQLEREQIKERSRMGRIERAKSGLFHGGGFTPIGYDYVDGELIINEYEALQVRKVYELFLAGTPISRIHTMMSETYQHKYGPWSQSSVVSVIKTPIYVGRISYLGETYEGSHAAIVDDETFKKANDRYELVRWNKHDGKHKKRPFLSEHILSGLLICGHCGARYFAKGNYSGRGENRYYRPYYTCYSRAKINKALVIDPNCKNKSYFHGDLDDIILNEIGKLSFDSSYFERIMMESQGKKPTNENLIIERQITEVDKQINRLLDLYQLGSMPMDKLIDRIEVLNQQKDQLLNQLVDDSVKSPRVSIDEAGHRLRDARPIIERGSQKEKRELAHSLIDKIVINGEDLTIHWAFA